MVRGAHEKLVVERFAAHSLMHRRALGPGAAPVVPLVERIEDVLEIARSDAIDSEARKKMPRVGDEIVGQLSSPSSSFRRRSQREPSGGFIGLRRGGIDLQDSPVELLEQRL